jgi:hypothetical protein
MGVIPETSEGVVPPAEPFRRATAIPLDPRLSRWGGGLYRLCRI